MKAQVSTWMGGISWAHELYRFLWPFQGYRDVTSGTQMERRLNYRHNVGLRVHLPQFVLKWGLISALCLFTAELCQRVLMHDTFAAACLVLVVLSLLMTVYIAAIYLYLGRTG